MTTQIISSGHTVSGATVRRGDTEIVVAGGSAVDTTVLNGGTFVFAGGSAKGLAASSGGHEIVTSRAKVRDFTVSVGVRASITESSTVVGGSVKSGGILTVSAPSPNTGQGGTVSAIVVSAGGVLNDFGAAQNTTVLSRGVVTVTGAINAATVSNGGTMNVRPGGYAGGVMVMRGGTLNVASGQIAGIRISSGGSLTLSQASALDTTVLGSLEIAGKVRNVAGLTISSGGTATIVSGGQVSSETITSGGRLVVESGGLTFGADLDGGMAVISSGGEVDGMTIASGGQLTFSGGKADGITVGAGARQRIGRSAIVSDMTYVDKAGALVLSSGGHLDTVSVVKGGTVVFRGGTIASLAADPGAREIVGVGASLNRPTVSEGVSLFVISGGTANNVTLDGASEIVASRGVAGGTTTFGSNAKLAVNTLTPALTVSKFGTTDEIDFISFKFGGSEKLSFVENAEKTRGDLTITDGPLKARVTLFGNYQAAGFHIAADSTGGTTLTTEHNPASEAHPDLAFSHT